MHHKKNSVHYKVTTSSYSAIKVPKGMTVYTPTGVYKAQMKNKLFILLLAFVLLLSACSNNSPPVNNTKEVLPELESAGSIESRGREIL